MADLPTLVFVHGALVRDAAWWWAPMRDPLAERGILTRAVRLPSCGETKLAPTGGLAEDVAAARAVIDELDGPVVLVGHSYGGMVISDAGTHPGVTQLIYVSSVMPEPGEAQGALAADHPAPWVLPGDDGTVSADPELIRTLFLQDCQPEVVAGALERLTAQPLEVFTTGPQAAAWQTTPSSFVVCTQDLAFPAEVQRRRIRPGVREVDFDAGHHPFLARPDAFAALLAELLGVGRGVR